MSLTLRTELLLLLSFEENKSHVAINAIFSLNSTCLSSCFRWLLRLLFLQRKNAIFGGSIIDGIISERKICRKSHDPRG